MNYPTHDTDWAISAKGNLWRRKDGVLLLVGKRTSDERFWARVGDNFLKGSFPTEESAKLAAENDGAGDELNSDFSDAWME
jgi:hypothetical protein